MCVMSTVTLSTMVTFFSVTTASCKLVMNTVLPIPIRLVTAGKRPAPMPMRRVCAIRRWVGLLRFGERTATTAKESGIEPEGAAQG